MTTLSLLFNLLSLALAGVMAVILFRMRRQEQARTEARAALLAQMSSTDFLSEPEPFDPTAPEWASEDADNDHLAAPAGLFAVTDPSSPWRVRLIIAAATMAVLTIGVGIALLRSPAADASRADAAAATRPLELTALDHIQDAARLTVSGRVTNPAGARPVSDLTATVFLFGADGSFAGSGRAPLDRPTLDVGAAAAFSVTIPVTAAVTRYRVSFRDSAGHALSHIDRRSPSSLARRR